MNPTVDALDRLANLIKDHGALLIGFAVLILCVLTGMLLLKRYFDQKLDQSKVTCQRALLGACPGQNLSTEDLIALINLKNDTKQAHMLKAHSMFGSIRMIKATTLNNITVSDLGRKMIFQDLLAIKFTVVATQWDAWLAAHMEEIKEDKMTGQFLLNEMMNLIANIVGTTDQQSKDKGIPESAIQAFRQWRDPSVETLIDNCAAAASSDWINTSTQRVALCMSHFEGTLSKLLVDAECALHSLNGSLTGQVYKGVTCGRPSPYDSPPGRLRLLQRSNF